MMAKSYTTQNQNFGLVAHLSDLQAQLTQLNEVRKQRDELRRKLEQLIANSTKVAEHVCQGRELARVWS